MYMLCQCCLVGIACDVKCRCLLVFIPVCTVCFVCFQACEECKAVSRKLHEKPNSIEELTDQREWMKQISDQLKAHEVQT